MYKLLPPGVYPIAEDKYISNIKYLPRTTVGCNTCRGKRDLHYIIGISSKYRPPALGNVIFFFLWFL
jgi:hypothetical protein